jgi:hypothetical protein
MCRYEAGRGADCGRMAPRTVFCPYVAGSTFEIVLTYHKSGHQFRRLDCDQSVFDYAH